MTLSMIMEETQDNSPRTSVPKTKWDESSFEAQLSSTMSDPFILETQCNRNI